MERGSTAESALEEEQLRLADRVSRQDDPSFSGGPVAGVDVVYAGDVAAACAVVIDTASFKTLVTLEHVRECHYPYVRGYFFLREGPVVMALLSQLEAGVPVLVNGNGVLHPRRCGLASHVGVLTGRQTIGVTKRLMLGHVGPRTGDWAPVIDNDETIGAALWPPGRSRPLYVSIGHRVSLPTALSIVRSATRSGLPEPLRLAHLRARDLLGRTVRSGAHRHP